ncbi:MAG TPA: iron-containing alcohol dehydrogenase [Stellaceae bacterium]|jgi:maleylacetate reductase|nr:iron-containing alcohol dehydrogenase [Stellaceae bacterium]
MLSGTHRYFLQERVIYGKPAAAAVAEEAAALGAGRAFITTTRSLAGESGLAAEIARSLGERHAGSFAGITAHSPRDAVIAGAALAREAQADLLVAVGGGSVIDATKVMLLALWQGLTSVDALDGYRGARGIDPSRRPPGLEGAIRMLAVPTTYSAAEFTFIAGVSDTRRRVKELYGHPLFTPQVVVLDPAATLQTPLELLLSTGMKAVDHAVERLSMLETNPYSDATAAEALKLLTAALPAIKRDPQALEPRLHGQLGMWLSITGAASGVGTAASHAIGHTLGGSYGIPHGITSCLTLPAVLRWNLRVNAERQARVSAEMGAPGRPAADLVAALVAALGLPGRLRDVGIRHEDLRPIAEHTMHDPPVRANPRPIRAPEDIVEILELAW